VPKGWLAADGSPATTTQPGPAPGCVVTQRGQHARTQGLQRATVETACAAHHLNRQPQTLRGWACLENGTLRVHGRWLTSAICWGWPRWGAPLPAELVGWLVG